MNRPRRRSTPTEAFGGLALLLAAPAGITWALGLDRFGTLAIALTATGAALLTLATLTRHRDTDGDGDGGGPAPEGAEAAVEHAGHPEPLELRAGIARTQDDLFDEDDRARSRSPIGFTRTPRLHTRRNQNGAAA